MFSLSRSQNIRDNSLRIDLCVGRVAPHFLSHHPTLDHLALRQVQRVLWQVLSWKIRQELALYSSSYDLVALVSPLLWILMRSISPIPPSHQRVPVRAGACRSTDGLQHNLRYILKYKAWDKLR
jgi:hypothetical protein